MGCVAAVAASGLYFARRLSGVVGSISMLVLAFLFLPKTMDDHTTLALWDPAYLEFPTYVAPAVLVVAGALVCWRFAMTPRAKTHTI